jgi:hypothetical protein
VFIEPICRCRSKVLDGMMARFDAGADVVIASRTGRAHASRARRRRGAG